MNRLRIMAVTYRANRLIKSRNKDLSQLTTTACVMALAAVVTLICVNVTR